MYFLGGRDGIDGGGGGGTGAIEEEDDTVADGADLLVERDGLDVITTWGCNAGIWYDVGYDDGIAWDISGWDWVRSI